MKTHLNMFADRAHRHAATLVEVTVSTALVGLVLVAAMDTTGSALRLARGGSTHNDAERLAAELIAEAIALPYDDPDGNTVGIGVEADEASPPVDRTAFDDLDDFDGWEENPPINADGTEKSFPGWSRRVFVEYIAAEPNVNDRFEVAASDEGVKRVTVLVWNPSGEQFRQRATRTRYGVVDLPAPFDATRVHGVSLAVELKGGATASAQATLVNDAEAP